MGAVRPPGNPKNLQRQTPFHIEIRDLKFLVQSFEFIVKSSVLGLLPLGRGLITEEHPTPKRTNLVYSAELPHLKWTPVGRGN